jgi:hypothetical protein
LRDEVCQRALRLKVRWSIAGVQERPQAFRVRAWVEDRIHFVQEQRRTVSLDPSEDDRLTRTYGMPGSRNQPGEHLQ